MQAAAVLAAANALHLHTLSLRRHVRVSLHLILRLVGHDQLAHAAARGSHRDCSQKAA